MKNVENFYKEREKIIEGFKNGVFPVYYDERHEHQMKAEKEIEEEEQEEQEEQEENKKNKKKNQKKANFLNILKINQKVLAIFCLIIILILNNLVLWQIYYLK